MIIISCKEGQSTNSSCFVVYVSVIISKFDTVLSVQNLTNRPSIELRDGSYMKPIFQAPPNDDRRSILPPIALPLRPKLDVAKRLMSSLINRDLPLQILHRPQITLRNIKPSVPLGQQPQQYQIDRVQRKVDPSQRHDRLVETGTLRDVPREPSLTVFRAIVSFDGEGDGDSQVVEGDEGVDGEWDDGSVLDASHSGGELEEDVEEFWRHRRETERRVSRGTRWRWLRR